MEHTSASYRAYRTSGRSAKRNRGNQSGLSPKERVRLVQLCVCLALFLAVFVGKGVFPQQLAQVQNKLVSALTADTDFRAAFSKLHLLCRSGRRSSGNANICGGSQKHKGA